MIRSFFMAVKAGISCSALVFVSTCLWVSIFTGFVLANVFWTVDLRVVRFAITFELTQTWIIILAYCLWLYLSHFQICFWNKNLGRAIFFWQPSFMKICTALHCSAQSAVSPNGRNAWLWIKHVQREGCHDRCLLIIGIFALACHPLPATAKVSLEISQNISPIYASKLHCTTVSSHCHCCNILVSLKFSRRIYQRQKSSFGAISLPPGYSWNLETKGMFTSL